MSPSDWERGWSLGAEAEVVAEMTLIPKRQTVEDISGELDQLLYESIAGFNVQMNNLVVALRRVFDHLIEAKKEEGDDGQQ